MTRCLWQSIACRSFIELSAVQLAHGSNFKAERLQSSMPAPPQTLQTMPSVLPVSLGMSKKCREDLLFCRRPLIDASFATKVFDAAGLFMAFVTFFFRSLMCGNMPDRRVSGQPLTLDQHVLLCIQPGNAFGDTVRFKLPDAACDLSASLHQQIRDQTKIEEKHSGSCLASNPCQHSSWHPEQTG